MIWETSKKSNKIKFWVNVTVSKQLHHDLNLRNENISQRTFKFSKHFFITRKFSFFFPSCYNAVMHSQKKYQINFSGDNKKLMLKVK